ncbi:MAG: hypothetical protein WDA07_14740 [Leucobacter sp.]
MAHEAFSMTGIKELQLARLDVDGLPKGLAGTLANGATAGMHYVKGISNVDVSRGQPERIARVGNGYLQDVFIFPSAEPPSGTGTGIVFDMALAAAAQTSKVATMGPMTMVAEGGPEERFPTFLAISMGWGASHEPGALRGLDIYWGHMFRTRFTMDSTPMLQRQGVDVNFNFGITPGAALPWGEALTKDTHGRTAAQVIRWAAPYPMTMVTFIGDGIEDTVVLPQKPAGDDTATPQVVFAYDATNEAMLTPTTDFTVNTTTDELVFEAGSIPAAGEIIQIPFFYLPEA